MQANKESVNKMDFVNRGFSVFLVIALGFLAITFLVNMLPVILLIGAGIWGVRYMVKAFRKWKFSRGKVFNRKIARFEKVEVMEKDFSENLTEENVIDVEYTEVR